MNPHFSFQRIKLLAIRYFTEHGRRDLVMMAALFFTFAFLPRLINNASPFTSPILFCIILFIGGMRFTARIFHEIHQPASGMHYLHIPASRLEKFLLNGAITLLLFPIICLLLYYGGTLFGNLVKPIVPTFLNYNVIDISSLVPTQYIRETASQYLFWHALFFLGALSFKKHPTTKTILSFILFVIALGIIQSLLAKIMWSVFEVPSTEILLKNVFQLVESWSYFDDLFHVSMFVFLWIVSYFKLKEKQV